MHKFFHHFPSVLSRLCWVKSYEKRLQCLSMKLNTVLLATICPQATDWTARELSTLIYRPNYRTGASVNNTQLY